MTGRAYPLPRPDDDPRFTFGLMLDVAAVLARRGYPTLTSGADLVELQQALFGFLYAAAPDDGQQHVEGPAVPAAPVVVERCECGALVADHRGAGWREAGACGSLVAFAPATLAGVDSVVCLGTDSEPCGHLGADHSDWGKPGGCRGCGCTRSYDHGKPGDDDAAGTVAAAVIGGARWTWRYEGAGIWQRVGSDGALTSRQLRALGAVVTDLPGASADDDDLAHRRAGAEAMLRAAERRAGTEADSDGRWTAQAGQLADEIASIDQALQPDGDQ
ncbi:hypothetical protein [Pseudofrankia inefficax]|uniref:Uncharacterized protein n=1 Tax=Pseudofrankia inefficax (strain DSM 45817 / CECT 9037 / DDB 130130 / EuI1c) TaxID=298654 RepID=E3J668_PSEI1|nr:hypothetical protein [Pseudofrankia inefficax]ADP78359.1 hypothetical protein FraEuI1c_0273 [Pseudofrankia inefficax]